MSDAAWQELNVQLRALTEAVDNLAWAVEQGQPGGDDPPPALVTDCEAHATDIAGLLREAVMAVQKAMQARDDWRLRQKLLAAGNDRFNRLWWRYYGESPFIRRRAAFQALRRSGGGWAGWVQGVDDALEQFGTRIFDTAQSFAGCWNALVETAGAKTVSFTANNIGQEFRIMARRDGETTSQVGEG